MNWRRKEKEKESMSGADRLMKGLEISQEKLRRQDKEHLALIEEWQRSEAIVRLANGLWEIVKAAPDAISIRSLIGSAIIGGIAVGYETAKQEQVELLEEMAK